MMAAVKEFVPAANCTGIDLLLSVLLEKEHVLVLFQAVLSTIQVKLALIWIENLNKLLLYVFIRRQWVSGRPVTGELF